MHFSTVNPGFVLGPVLDRDYGTSADAIAMFLHGKSRLRRNSPSPVVDVRDIAKAHSLALETIAPAAAVISASPKRHGSST